MSSNRLQVPLTWLLNDRIYWEAFWTSHNLIKWPIKFIFRWNSACYYLFKKKKSKTRLEKCIWLIQISTSWFKCLLFESQMAFNTIYYTLYYPSSLNIVRIVGEKWMRSSCVSYKSSYLIYVSQQEKNVFKRSRYFKGSYSCSLQSAVKFLLYYNMENTLTLICTQIKRIII